MWKLGENHGRSAQVSAHFEASETLHNVFLCLLRHSHDLEALLNFLMHVDMFSGLYTSQASGDILVRMCVSWEKIMVDQRRIRRILKEMKQCIMPFAPLTRPAGFFKCSNACRHVQWDVH